MYRTHSRRFILAAVDQHRQGTVGRLVQKKNYAGIKQMSINPSSQQTCKPPAAVALLFVLLATGCATSDNTDDIASATPVVADDPSDPKVVCTAIVDGASTTMYVATSECNRLKSVPQTMSTKDKDYTLPPDTAKIACKANPMVLIESKSAVRQTCRQRRISDSVKQEFNIFRPAIGSDDSFEVFHRRVVDPNLYYPPVGKTVEEQLKVRFTTLRSSVFDKAGEAGFGLGKTYKYIAFSDDGKQCFGFTKNNRQSLSLGFLCRPGDAYEKDEIKQILKQIKFY